MKYAFLIFSSIVLALFFQACQNDSADGEDRLLAEVSGKSLFLSDMEGMIPNGMSAEDSTMIIDAYVSRWIRDAILLVEAEGSIPENLDIDKLVEDYRSSLILDNYKKALMEESLDSTVTSEQLSEFYKKHREGYYLEEDIVSAHVMIIPRDVDNISQVRSWWNNISPETLIELRSFCLNNNSTCFLDENNWFSTEELADLWPRESVNPRDLWNNRDLQRQDDDFYYFYKRVERLESGTIAPMEYVEDQIKRLILHQRKIRLVEETQDRMYDRAMRDKAIRVY